MDLVALNGPTSEFLKGALGDSAFSGSLFELASFHQPKGLLVTRLLVIGSGTKHDFNFEVACRLAGTAARHVRLSGVREIAFLMRGELSAERRGQACVEGTLLGTLEMGKYKTRNLARPVLDSIMLLASKPGEEDELREGAERGMRTR